ncbi:hypothetical protein PPYR_12078 [Photinus pyralis]|uniref:G-protein coupled receptors family 3 profile domain-containing protein n=1 Tax=Photinus pyralis TaxID=7054 RepID=A0A5N4AD75_PHOPY|nr:uncharacterized protein LOC116175317 [Photinus pyralis]KAB0795239.1 hypothetical protein PPYR_12078 [Photinus pyralis]
MRFVLIIFTLANVLIASGTSVCGVNEVYDNKKDLNFALLLQECSPINPESWTYINSAIWTADRLNKLNFTSPFNFGLTVYQTCSEAEDYDAIYKIFKEEETGILVGALSNHPLSKNSKRFSDALDLRFVVTDSYQIWIFEAAVKFLLTFDSSTNVTIYAENENVLRILYSLTKNANICVQNGHVLKELSRIEKPTNGIEVIVSRRETVKAFLANSTQCNDTQMVFVPLDSSFNIDFPDGSYVIRPLLAETMNDTKFDPSPIFFSIANHLVQAAARISEVAVGSCNQTGDKLTCLRNTRRRHFDNSAKLDPFHVLSILNVEQAPDGFAYNIFRVENLTLINDLNVAYNADYLQYFTHIFTYILFNKSLVSANDGNTSVVFDRDPVCQMCRYQCANFVPKAPPKRILISYAFSKFGLRTDSWVYAFLAVSLLGVILCLAVFIFIVVRFCKNDIFEGNPSLTIILLVTVVLMYCSVIPFAIDTDKEARGYLCVVKALSTTLTYAFAFSVLLSRSILLATISKEVGFMAHVAGPVQSFLTLFIFGVQGALSLQFVSHCEDVFHGISFVYLMCYNVILLVLLLFICPLNTRSQRNYKEGKYFTVAISIIACVWSCWIPGYAVFDQEWKEPMLCLGLVSTASILLGAIFIPRTYMMTVAATRDRLTSVLPSLQANSSLVDVYRASTQPIYDCINIAAITARCGPPAAPPLPQPEVYSTLPTAYEEDFQFVRPPSPDTDKVTRF